MAKVVLTVRGLGESRQVEPSPEGTIVGRSARCDVVVDSREVSREHVRIFRDPFGRWIFEDLGSSNGMFVDGKRVESSAVLPGQIVLIGPVSLSIKMFSEEQIERDDSAQSTNIIMDDFETEVFYRVREPKAAAARPFPEKSDRISERLGELTSPTALYPEVCMALAEAPKTVAMVLRVPEKGKPVPKTPEILACHFGDRPDETGAPVGAGLYPSHLAFRVSRHVLEEVRVRGKAMMAKSIYSSDVEITTTAVDEHSPRAVICVPLGGSAGTVELLYVDIPIDNTVKSTPEEMFAFVQAVAREVVSTRRSLLLMKLKARRSTLDHELSLAADIQSRLAPVVPGDLSSVDVAVLYKPVEWVGGDYCDVWSVDNGRLAFAVGEVSANGLAAALALSTLRTLLRITVSFGGELSEVVRHVSANLRGSLPEDMSVALFLGVFDTSKGTLEYVNAGHMQPLLVDGRSSAAALGRANRRGCPRGGRAGPDGRRAGSCYRRRDKSKIS
jgi:hypothetical protein